MRGNGVLAVLPSKKKRYRYNNVHHRSFDRSMPEDLARIAVLPSHVQADRSSPFTDDLLLARTCNQGKIVDICRPSAGNSLPEGRLSPSVPRPFVSPPAKRALVASKVHERTEIARMRGRAYKFVPLFLVAPLLRASRLHARCKVRFRFIMT